MSLEMKYFVLKPRSKKIGDKYARAARIAMRAYAEAIRETDPELAEELWAWTNKEIEREEAFEWEEKL